MADATPEMSVEEVSGQPDHYAHHLAEVNKTSEVVSTEDICNKGGILVVRKGSRISHDVAQKLLQHRLAKSLEQQVQVENALTGPALLKSFSALLEKFPDARKIHETTHFTERFEKILTTSNFDPIFVQKITVLHAQQQSEFEKALFCGWLGALLVTEMGLGSDIIHAAFLAGVMHDIGLLHLPPEIVNKSGELTASDWRALQSHVVIGQLVVKSMKGMNQRAAIAVLEHHERCDGTGYPSGKTEEALDLVGQVIGLADSVYAIRTQQFAKVGRNLRDTLPYLQMNSTTHTVAVYNAMHALLKKSNLAPTKVNPLNDFGALVEHLSARGLQLNGVVNLLEGLAALSATSGAGAEGKKLQKVTQPVARMIRSSGLLGAEILNWLDALRTQPDASALQDLVEMELMQNELYWQLKKVQRTLGEFLNKNGAKLVSLEGQRYTKISDELTRCLAKSQF